MTNEEKMIRFVAEKLGTRMGETPLGRTWVDISLPDEMYIDAKSMAFVVLFAAYAKAEMAKNLYVFSVGSKSCGIYWPKLTAPKYREMVAASDLDDIDPISEAWAIIKAINEALGGE